MIFLDLLSAEVFITAALCLFLMLLNRRLILLRDSRIKAPLIVLVFVSFVAGSGVAGYVAGFSLWIALPAAVLCAVAAGETRRLYLRRRYRAPAPVSVIDAQASRNGPLTTTALQVAHYEAEHPAWRGGDLTIAHVSDFHVNDNVPPSFYRTVMEQVNAADPDLVFITGDFVSRKEYVSRLPGILETVEGRLGIFAVLGNHDYWADNDAVAEAVRGAGIDLLHNDCRSVRTAGGGEIRICGCEDPWGKGRWREPGAFDNGMTLALTHTADNIYTLSRAGVAAVFAGHNHAGQVKLPMLGSICVPSRYGRRFDHGHFIVDGTHLFVTSGIGVAIPSFRIYCRPDVFVVRFGNSRASA
jgi:predicted MPP superfamily phosphohydrolase